MQFIVIIHYIFFYVFKRSLIVTKALFLNKKILKYYYNIKEVFVTTTTAHSE